jgi:hypothetical protein
MLRYAFLLLTVFLSHACSDTLEISLPEVPGQDITVQFADGTERKFTALVVSGNDRASQGILRYLSTNSLSAPRTLLLTRGRTSTPEFIRIQGNFPLEASDFDAEGFLQRASLSFPRQLEMDIFMATPQGPCQWSNPVVIEEWDDAGVMRGSFTFPSEASCPVESHTIVGGSFAVYVAAVKID